MMQTISLSVNGDSYLVTVDPGRTLASVLREDLNLTGTKIGCGSGDCGACTVLLDGRSVVSCLTLAIEADGREIMTVEGLASSGRELHPIQRAFVEKGAIQCGFCTPGMEMSTYYLLSRHPQPTETEIRLGLSGNLCRCTGYNKIVEAVAAAAEQMPPPPPPASGGVGGGSTRAGRPYEADGRAVRPPVGGGYAAPATVEEACALLAEAGGRAVLVGGGTDVVPRLKAAAPQARPHVIVGLRGIPELHTLTCGPGSGLYIGAMVRLADVAEHPGIRALYSAVAEAAAVTGTPQIRNMGTVVGNLCNAAPSADNAPALLALDAVVHIAGPGGRRSLSLAEFFAGPGVVRLEDGEIVTAVSVAPCPPRSGLSYQHLSERGRVDISAVGVAAFLASTADGTCVQARIALGGVAPTPLRVPEAEALLVGCPIDGPEAEEAWKRAAAAAAEAARPISDMRASAGYRRRMVQVLATRALAEAAMRARACPESDGRLTERGPA